MSKKKENNHKLPPRYPTGDPRNKARMEAGGKIGQKMLGFHMPVRKLRKRDGSYMVTIPGWLVKEHGFEVGDDIVFGNGGVPGAMLIAALKSKEHPAGTQDDHPGVPF